MDFRYVHIYKDDPAANLDAKEIVKEIAGIFPSCKIDLRRPFFQHWQVQEVAMQFAKSRITDIKQPFEKQPEIEEELSRGLPPLYDGFSLQNLLRSMISEEESSIDHLHIIIANLLTCTFSEDDWRYHARTVICGNPSIVSTSGIVEGPAKPREFYLSLFAGEPEINLKRKFAGSFIDHGDDRITAAAAGCVLQAIFFFLADGDPFCKDGYCRLFNAHWQQDLIRAQIEKPAFCKEHQALVDKFNRKKGDL